MKISVNDYLYSLTENSDEFFCIKLIFDEFGYFLDFLMSHFKIAGAHPVCFIDTSLKPLAQSKLNEITVSRGLIDLSLRAYGNSIEAFEETNFKFTEENKFEKIGGILWIIAHEFFHYARQHSLVLKNNSGLAHALEYDADCLAVAGLYRYFHKTYNSTLTNFEVKTRVLSSFYWPVRELIGVDEICSKPVTTHPDFSLRLRYSVQKLWNMDVPHQNLGSTKITKDESYKLFQYQLECEKRFLEGKSLEMSQSEYLKDFLLQIENRDIKFSQIGALWIIAEPLVKNVSLFFDDIIRKGTGLMMLNEQFSIIKMGWIYTSISVHGFFLPAFHNKHGKENIYSYSNYCIEPNPYWVPDVPHMLSLLFRPIA